MRYAQVCHCVRDFPTFPDPAWHLFIYAIAEELEEILPGSLDIRFKRTRSGPMLAGRRQEEILSALAFTVIVDHATDRMRLDTDSTWGKELGEHFSELAERIFRIAWEIRGFVEIG